MSLIVAVFYVSFAAVSTGDDAVLMYLTGGCHSSRESRLNQALSVLSLGVVFFLSMSVVLLTRATFCIMLFVCSVSRLFLLGCQYQCK